MAVGGIRTMLAATASSTLVAAAGTTEDPWSLLIGYGPLGLIAALLIFGKLRTEAEVKGLEERIKAWQDIVAQKDAQIIALQNGYTDKAIPTLARAIMILERLEEDRRGRGSGR